MKYLALLRGINVSGKKIIKMEDLRRLMEAEGYTNVKTYIQSGNVVFESPQKSPDTVAKTIEALIEKQYGFDVSVFILTIRQLEQAIDNNPFADGREPEPSGTKKIYVTFLSETPPAENMEKLRQAPIGEDLIELMDDVLYFKLAAGAADSKLSNSFIESKLKVRATARNWNTTLKLLSMMESDAKDV